MKRNGIRVVIGFLAVIIGGLTISSQAQQPKVTFKYKDVIVPGAVSSVAYGINKKNVIVGAYTDAAGQQHGMYVKGAKIWGPSCPGYLDTALYAVNSAGTAVADCWNGGGPDGVRGDALQGLCDSPYQPCALLYDNHVLIPDPNPPCDCPYMLLAINSIVTGPQVGGWFQDDQGIHGFVSNLQTGAVEILDVPGASNTTVWSINNAGEAALQATDTAGLMHSYLYDGTSYRNIDVPGALQSFVHGINNDGDILYTVEDASGTSEPVLYCSGKFTDLNQETNHKKLLAHGLTDEVEVLKEKLKRLKIVGDYVLQGSDQSQAFVGTVTIKP